ncbi:MAG TPA: SagB/ThcOx family dehydrogenase [Syntrophorhabdaceae bacterium]|nr:SagB/ThcOx family dehydrogenase [Syntrophorhabdaceae bacterium]
MQKYALFIAVLILCGTFQMNGIASSPQNHVPMPLIKLPAPRYTSDTSIEKALHERRSVRKYKALPLTILEVSQILWAAQGITDSKRGARTAPSSHASYPLEIFAAVGNVVGLTPGLYRYVPRDHELVQIIQGPVRDNLYRAVKQEQIRNAPLAVIITGKFVQRGSNQEYVFVEAGHVSQNIYLQSESLTLGTVAMMGFKPDEVKRVLELPIDRTPIYLMTLGKK